MPNGDSQMYHIMTSFSTATVRELRGSFPTVRKLVESEGSVIVSERGRPKYLLKLYTPPPGAKPKAKDKDYLARLKKFQPRPISNTAARTLHEENRGDR